jgi:hypothetical protein
MAFALVVVLDRADLRADLGLYLFEPAAETLDAILTADASLHLGQRAQACGRDRILALDARAIIALPQTVERRLQTMYALHEQLSGSKADLSANDFLSLVELIAVSPTDRPRRLFERDGTVHQAEPTDGSYQVLLQPLLDSFHVRPPFLVLMRREATTMPNRERKDSAG